MFADSLLFQRNPDPMWVYDPDTLAFVEVNPAAVREYGYTSEEFLRLTLADIYAPEDRDRLSTEVNACRDERDFVAISRHCTKNGDLIEMEVRSQVLDHQGRRLRLAVARNTASLPAPRREAMMEAAVRLAGVGAWRITYPFTEVEWSAETAKIHQAPDTRLIPVEAAANYFVPEFRPQLLEAFRNCVESGTPYEQIVELQTGTNQRVWVRTVAEAVRDETGRIVAVRGAFQNVTEIVRMRQTADELRKRLERTIERISDAFYSVDREWRFTYLNSQAEKLLRRPRHELLGRNVWEEFPEAKDLLLGSEYHAALERRETRAFVFFYPPLNTWFHVTAYPVEDGLAVYFRDITAERASQQQLRLLTAAAERMNDILVITEGGSLNEPHGPKIVYVNDAFVRRTGFSREEASGRTPRILQGPETSRSELDRIRAALESGAPVRAEVINYTKAGEPFWLELDITPLADESGSVTHWISVQRDITERKQIESRLRESEERFRLIASATNDLIWDYNPETHLVWWNEKGRQLLGAAGPDSRAPLDEWAAMIHPDERSDVYDSFKAALAGNSQTWSREYRLISADGAVRLMTDRAFIIRDENGAVVRAVGSMTDITEERRLELRLRQAQKLEALGQLTGGIAHDFNNLLTVILGNSEALVEELADQPELADLAKMTENAAERGADLTNRLLAFARKQPLDPRPTDVNQLIGEMEGLIRRTLGADMNIAMIPGERLWPAQIDPAQMESALLNLCLNARDAMAPKGGLLTIETANAFLDEEYASQIAEVSPGDYVMLAVTDTGCGMTPDVLSRIFEPFFTTKHAERGTGLGMSMVFGFIKQSGGHIKIYSEPGEGTTVQLYLPRAMEDAIDHPRRSTPLSKAGRGETILVVEDDELVRSQAEFHLMSLGYVVLTAANGEQALRVLQGRAQIDLLMTDVVMPGGMNGRELAEAAWKMRPGLPVLFTSGYTQNAIVHQGRLDPGMHLLQKPYRRSDLSDKIRSVLRKA